MLANIRAVVRTAALSVGATGLIALGSSLISGLPSSTGLDGLGVALPAVSTDALEIDLAGAHTPDLSAPTIHEETLSRRWGRLPAGEHGRLAPPGRRATSSPAGARPSRRAGAVRAHSQRQARLRAGQSPAADYATSARLSGSKRPAPDRTLTSLTLPSRRAYPRKDSSPCGLLGEG